MTRLSITARTLGVTTALAASAVVGTASAQAATPTGRAQVKFHESNSHRVSAPDTTRPGIVHLHNIGSDELIVVAAKSQRADATLLAKELNKSGKSAVKDLLEDFTFVALTQKHESVYARFSHGSYFVADVSGKKVTAANIARLSVTGDKVNAKLPASKRLLAAKSGKITVARTLARHGYLHLVNRSAALRAPFLFGVKKDVTAAQLKDLEQHPTEKKLDNVVAAPFTILGYVGPRSDVRVHYQVKAGRHVIVDVAASNGGTSNLHAGDVRVFTAK